MQVSSNSFGPTWQNIEFKCFKFEILLNTIKAHFFISNNTLHNELPIIYDLAKTYDELYRSLQNHRKIFHNRTDIYINVSGEPQNI